MPEPQINPWSNNQSVDVEKLFSDFGIDPILGVSWDGTGYGNDGTVWGGEFLLTNDDGFARVASLRPFRLPGGEKAVREPRRSAVGVLHEMFRETLLEPARVPATVACAPAEIELFVKMIGRQLNAPVTTSAGRLFDAVASIAGIRQVSNFEGQAAMELEFAAGHSPGRDGDGPAGNGAAGAFVVRDGAMKLIYHVGMPPQLFDLAGDPDETRDLAGARPATVAALEGKLRAICDPEAVDAGR